MMTPMKNNRYLLIPFFGLLSFGFFGASAKQACARSSSAEVLGYVSNCSANVPFEPVTATCGTETLSGQTGSTGGDLGKYSLTFHNASCKKNSVVTVTSGGVTNTGTIGNYFFFSNIGNVDIQLGTDCDTSSVPEFGILQKLIAIFAAASIFFYFHNQTTAKRTSK